MKDDKSETMVEEVMQMEEDTDQTKLDLDNIRSCSRFCLMSNSCRLDRKLPNEVSGDFQSYPISGEDIDQNADRKGADIAESTVFKMIIDDVKIRYSIIEHMLYAVVDVCLVMQHTKKCNTDNKVQRDATQRTTECNGNLCKTEIQLE